MAPSTTTEEFDGIIRTPRDGDRASGAFSGWRGDDPPTSAPSTDFLGVADDYRRPFLLTSSHFHVCRLPYTTVASHVPLLRFLSAGYCNVAALIRRPGRRWWCHRAAAVRKLISIVTVSGRVSTVTGLDTNSVGDDASLSASRSVGRSVPVLPCTSRTARIGDRICVRALDESIIRRRRRLISSRRSAAHRRRRPPPAVRRPRCSIHSVSNVLTVGRTAVRSVIR